VSFHSVFFAMSVGITETDEPRRLMSVAEGIDARINERVSRPPRLRSSRDSPRRPASTR